MESQTIDVAATVILNAIIIIWCIRETFVRHQQAKELQNSHARLESEVHRLSVNLNQEIVRLNRINDLTRGLYLSSARLHFKYALLPERERARSDSKHKEIYSIDEVVDYFTTVEGSTVEMRAIARVIGDSELMSLIDKLKGGVPTQSMNGSHDDFILHLLEFGHHATSLHERVYQLLEAATENRDYEGQNEANRKPT